MMIYVFDRVEKHCGKKRKCWLPAFSPFTTMFSKALFLRVIMSHDCVAELISIIETPSNATNQFNRFPNYRF